VYVPFATIKLHIFLVISQQKCKKEVKKEAKSQKKTNKKNHTSTKTPIMRTREPIFPLKKFYL